MLPALSPATVDALRTALDRAGYRTDGVRALLGREAHAALGRGEPEPAYRATADGGALGVLVRLLLLGSVEPEAAVAAALAPLAPADAAAAGLLRRATARTGVTAGPPPWTCGRTGTTAGTTRAATGGCSPTSTPAARSATTSPASAARRSRWRPRRCAPPPTPCSTWAPAAGCRPCTPRGTPARSPPPTSRRARSRMARATFALNGLDVELLDGPWLAPVAGRRFDRIVSNPPFVPGPARVDYVYRDSGQAGDDALAALVRALPDHLEPGGVAQLLGSWLHVRGQDWPDRVRSWLPERRRRVDRAARGHRPGAARRDLAARRGAGPGLPRGPRAGRGVAGLAGRAEGGGGRVRVPDPAAVPGGDAATVVVEDLPGDLDDPLGPEVAGWLDRVDWLRAHATDDALLGARLRLADGVVLERYATAGDEGWTDAGAAVARAEGPRWRHEVDEPAAALLAGCRGALPLGELVALLALAHDRPVGRARRRGAARRARAGAARVAGAASVGAA